MARSRAFSVMAFSVMLMLCMIVVRMVMVGMVSMRGVVMFFPSMGLMLIVMSCC